MHKIIIKYPQIIYSLLLLNLNFFFLAPYFHHHHIENEFTEKKSEVIHSHLFNDTSHEPFSEEADHHYEHENHDLHLVQNNLVFSITLTKSVQPTLHLNIYYELKHTFVNRKISSIDLPTIVSLPKQQWENYVHFASNVSPPLV